MQGRSLGLIETVGYAAAVEAVDTACKTGKVLFLGHDFAGKGLVTVKFSGDVAAVRVAVTAGAAAAQKLGRVVSVHVIPRPDKQLDGVGPASPGSPPLKEAGPRSMTEGPLPPAKSKRVSDRDRPGAKRPKAGKSGRKPKKQAP